VVWNVQVTGSYLQRNLTGSLICALSAASEDASELPATGRTGEMTVEQTKRRLIERAQDLSRQIHGTDDPWRIAALGEDLERTISELQQMTPSEGSSRNQQRPAAVNGRE